MVCIGVIGDYEPRNETHLATAAAVEHASTYQGVSAEVTWISTGRVADGGEDALTGLDGLIIAPGSPYRSMLGAQTPSMLSTTPTLLRCSSPRWPAPSPARA